MAYYQPFKDGKEFITGSVSDRWGTWIRVFILIKDEATGNTIAMFGIDFNAKSWDKSLLFQTIQSSMIIVLFLLAFFFLFSIKAKNRALKQEIIWRKQAENAMLKSENQKAAILKVIPDLLFVFNQNGDYLQVYTEDDSKLFEPKESIIGKNISNLFPPEITHQALEAFKQSLLSSLF